MIPPEDSDFDTHDVFCCCTISDAKTFNSPCGHRGSTYQSPVLFWNNWKQHVTVAEGYLLSYHPQTCSSSRKQHGHTNTSSHPADLDVLRSLPLRPIDVIFVAFINELSGVFLLRKVSEFHPRNAVTLEELRFIWLNKTACPSDYHQIILPLVIDPPPVLT